MDRGQCKKLPLEVYALHLYFIYLIIIWQIYVLDQINIEDNNIGVSMHVIAKLNINIWEIKRLCY